MPLLGIYCTFSIQSVVYLHVFRLLKKRRFESFFYMRILLTLLLQTVYIFNCYFSETFLELNSLTKATTSISHLWNSLNLCGESKYHNRYICHPFIHSFWMFKVIKRSIFIAFIVIQVIDDTIYFDLPSVQNVNSNNYFRCLWMSGFISLNTIHKSSSTYRLSPAFVQWVALCMSLLVEHLSTVLYSPYIVTQTTTCMEERAVYHFGK